MIADVMETFSSSVYFRIQEIPSTNCFKSFEVFSAKDIALSSWTCTRFFIRKIFIKKWGSKPKNHKKVLRKSSVSNAWAAIFKNADFS